MNSDNRQDVSEPEVVLGRNGQLTLPAWIRDALGLREGDRLVLSIAGQSLTMTPRRAMAFEALREIRAAFAGAGVSEEELQAEGRHVREELTRSRYGAA
jgi:AbrB family looped-hinge helix DNA binding protein